MIYPCGCHNELDENSGMIRCVSKCDFQVNALGNIKSDDAVYYTTLGSIADGAPRAKLYIRELQDSGLFIRPSPSLAQMRRALEIGCGCSGYVPLLLKLGYNYYGIDTSDYAVKWTSQAYDDDTYRVSLEEMNGSQRFDLILAAHVLEHFKDAPAALVKMYGLLNPGGQLCVIVPNGDDDPTSPDHWWFMTESSLLSYATRVGFVDITMNQRRVVEHERFIYMSASKRGEKS